VGKEVEGLKYHPHDAAELVCPALEFLFIAGPGSIPFQRYAVDQEPPIIKRLQPVQATEQSRFPAPGWSDQNGQPTAVHGQIDAAQHRGSVKRLLQSPHFDEMLSHGMS
jgi:hypothetical protein